MDKLQIFSAISSLTLIAGIYYYNQLVEKLKSNNLKLQGEIKSLNEKIDSIFNTEKNKFLSEVRNDIKKDKDNFRQEIKDSFEAFGEDIVFEFKVDETLCKSEFISLRKLISDKKDKYSFLLSSLLTKNSNDKKEIESLKLELKNVDSSIDSFKYKLNTHVAEIKEFVKTSTLKSKKGQVMAKDFEERISNLESLSFEKVMDEGSSGDDYSFIGDSDSTEMEDLNMNYSNPRPLKPNNFNNDNGYKRY
jgi:Ni,Fe-hydrogenase I large subunit